MKPPQKWVGASFFASAKKHDDKPARTVSIGTQLCAWFIACLMLIAGTVHAGTWTPLAHTAPGVVGHMLLLPDGTVMAENNNDGGTYGPVWYRLTPDSTGSYVNGTWTTLASMNDTRLFFASRVLTDGRVFVAGGEYGTGGAKGEVYNPQTNIWTETPTPGHTFSDANSEILPDGRVLVELVEGSLTGTLIYDPVANTWTTGPSSHGISNESCWVKLPDDSILFVDRLTTNSERYIPASNTWITDATVPVSLYDPYGDESGPGMLLPNGKVIFFGAFGHNAIYTPSGSTANGTWVAGPDFPNGQAMPDAPCAMMPNGKILCATAPIPVSGNVFQSPTSFYEYDYVANSFTQVNAPAGGTTETGSSFQRDMLLLPDGTVMSSRFSSQLYVYSGGGTPLAAAKPTVSTITQNADGSFHLTGTQLNGISEGAAYGDDNQCATNYPIVRLASGSNVYYCRTYNWSRTSVATGSTSVTTEFSVPASVPSGTYSLFVVANGIASDAFSFTITPSPLVVTPSGGLTATGIVGGPFTPASAIYTLTNSGSTSFTWTASKTQPWIDLSSTGGTLGAGGNTTVTVSFNSAANGLAAGSYSDAVSFSDSTSGVIQTRAVSLTTIDALGISPATGLTAIGSAGGPFTPSSATYTLTNNGSSPLTWTASNTQGWVTLSSTGGTLAGGGNTTVTVSFGSAANSLAIGSYADTVTFTNVSAGKSSTRAVSLTVSHDYFTELLSSGMDTGNQSWLFTPNGSANYYSVRHTTSVTSFPTNPAGGTTLTESDDSSVHVTPAGGAQVQLYGTSYSSFYVGSNGYITFTSGDTSYSESLATHFNQPRISPLFVDLNPGAGGTVSWQQFADRIVVTWQNVPNYGITNSNNFQVEMFLDGRIRITCLGIASTHGLIGLSQGLGVPGDYSASDFDTYAAAALSNVADLANLSLSAGTLLPGFAAGTTGYTASVPASTGSITVTPTAADSVESVKVNGVAVTSGGASGAIGLSFGINPPITMVVTAQDGISTKTYTVTVTRLSTNADLSGLALSAGTLTPGFSSGTTSYAASVFNATASITVTPTLSDSNATVKVNGVTVASGSASGAISLAEGVNPPITAVVTAQDGTTTKTYAVVVTRSSSVAAVFNLATDVPVTASSYSAAGKAVYFTLNFSPAVGSNLTVVKNTGLGFISGTFENLAQGQAVALSFNGATYNYVANYYGGTGNDLVLQWASGRSMGWGLGTSGQLGGNSTVNSSVPAAVSTSGILSNKTVIAMAAGQNHTLALCSDGTLSAWGANAYGQFGNGTFANSSVPVAVNASGVLATKTVIAVAAGLYHSMALCSDGTVATWGYNNYGQLGNNSTANSNVPVAVSTVGTPLATRTVVGIAAGQYHSLALCSDGTVAAWGYNNYGQLGNNSTASSSVPVAVSTTGTPLATRTVTALAGGYYHTLALCSDGTVAAWGYNGNAQLGNNGYLNSSLPVAVSTAGTPLQGNPVTAIAAGAYHSMALCSDGTVASWGNNGIGQLGDGSTVQRTVPVAVQTAGTPLSGKTVTSVAAAAYDGFALCADGTLAAWGYNGAGELGNNSATNSNVPVAVSTASLLSGERFALIAGGQSAFHSLAFVGTPSPPPTVTTEAATSIASTGATLNGTVNANGNPATVSFDFGTDTTYGTNVPGTPASVTGGSVTPVNVTLSGLHAGITYHFRVNGVSVFGSSNGSDMKFTTPPMTPQDWRQRWYGTTNDTGNAADGADPYQTGIPNLVVFAFIGPDQNPAHASVGQLPKPQFAGGNFTFSFTQPAGATGVTYGAEWRPALDTGIWLPVADTGSSGVHTFSVPIGSNTKLFMHLTVSSP